MKLSTLPAKLRRYLAFTRAHGVRAAVRRWIDGPVDEMHYLYDLVRNERGVMVDVGAHYGSAFAPFAKAGWRVVAFEPDATNRAELVRRFGGASNVVIDPRAVSDKPARGAAFFRSDVSAGISGLSSFHESHVASGTVEVTTLADVCRELTLDRIDVLKIDTEGHDLLVLRGLLPAIRPQAILCEFEDSKTIPLGYTFHDLARHLVALDYRVVVSEWFPVVRYGAMHRWRRFEQYPCELADTRAWGNLIAVIDPLHAPLQRLLRQR